MRWCDVRPSFDLVTTFVCRISGRDIGPAEDRLCVCVVVVVDYLL